MLRGVLSQESTEFLKSENSRRGSLWVTFGISYLYGYPYNFNLFFYERIV